MNFSPNLYSSSALFYIAGDFNSQLEYRKYDEEFIGKHSRGRRNINGIALGDFLEALVLFVCNTSFQHPARHKSTWQGQRRNMTSGHIVPIYNVIDFVNCRQPYRSLLTDSRSYAGIWLDSDHRQLVAELDLMRIFDVWGRIEKLRMSKHVRYNTELLATKCFREQFQDVVSVS